jgi:hypothetical protein
MDRQIELAFLPRRFGRGGGRRENEPHGEEAEP